MRTSHNTPATISTIGSTSATRPRSRAVHPDRLPARRILWCRRVSRIDRVARSMKSRMIVGVK
jgi:hypothetical protein